MLHEGFQLSAAFDMTQALSKFRTKESENNFDV